MQPSRISQKLDQLTPDEYTKFRMLVGKLNWAVQGSRPDMGFDMVELSTKFKKATVNDLIRAIKCIRKLKESQCCLMFPEIGQVAQWKIIIFSDAAHANLSDGVSSMAGLDDMSFFSVKETNVVLYLGNQTRSNVLCDPLLLQKLLVYKQL